MITIRKLTRIIFYLSCLLFVISCKKDKPDENNTTIIPSGGPYLIFKFRFDSTQARLNNLGQSAVLPAGHSAQHPLMNKMSAHYIELSPSMTTPVGAGRVLYHAPETTLGGSTAILHSQSVMKADGEEFFRFPIDSIPAGTYNYLRISVAYQNYDIKYKYVFNGTPLYLNGTIASFVGYNTYVNTYTIKTQTVSPSATQGGTGNHLQGYWGFETTVAGVTSVSDGQSPPGATTVVNPLWSSSPIPPGSCLVTGQFANGLTINGNETIDKTIVVSFSTNRSFEWKDFNADGWFEPQGGDTVVDMGLRGMIPLVQ